MLTKSRICFSPAACVRRRKTCGGESSRVMFGGSSLTPSNVNGLKTAWVMSHAFTTSPQCARRMGCFADGNNCLRSDWTWGFIDRQTFFTNPNACRWISWLTVGKASSALQQMSLQWYLGRRSGISPPEQAVPWSSHHFLLWILTVCFPWVNACTSWGARAWCLSPMPSSVPWQQTPWLSFLIFLAGSIASSPTAWFFLVASCAQDCLRSGFALRRRRRNPESKKDALVWYLVFAETVVKLGASHNPVIAIDWILDSSMCSLILNDWLRISNQHSKIDWEEEGGWQERLLTWHLDSCPNT